MENSTFVTGEALLYPLANFSTSQIGEKTHFYFFTFLRIAVPMSHTFTADTVLFYTIEIPAPQRLRFISFHLLCVWCYTKC